VSRNVVYAIVCTRCKKTYIGETGRRLADRFREHLYSITNDRGTRIDTHFNQVGHDGVHDIQVTALVSFSGSDRGRLSLENRLIAHFGVLFPDGLNRILTQV
jgi:predicted GIY-YIG superfamily endonuclease